MLRLLKSRVFVGTLVAAALAAGLGLYWFQPWKLWTDETVRESLPSAASSATAPAMAEDPGTATAEDPGATELRTVAAGTLISHEHPTSGKAKLLRLPDGSHTLRLEGLDTSNGPDLRVWITDAPVKEGKAGWHVFDDGKYQSLGKLKGNKGDQNYALPAGLDLDRYTSVSIWCDRFDVSFGAAELVRA
ncbi:DM13 domain-containing protein [Streptomyces sp. T-3]|nr:DM13 domain-containing protein [Streptomyces sp. T-3]